MIRIIEDPEAARASLDALIALQDQLATRSAELDAREKAVSEGEAVLAGANKKLKADRAAVESEAAAVAMSREHVDRAVAELKQLKATAGQVSG